MVGAVYDAIVLAGGAARRLGGVAKPQLRVGRLTLLEHVLAAVADAARTIVVGPEQTVSRDVVWCREQPPGGGPVAAVAAAVPATASATVVVLAADLPAVGPAVPVLIAAVPDDGVSLLVAGDGRANYLAAAWRRAALLTALARLGDPANAAMRALFAGVPRREVSDSDGWGRDCDTWDDLVRARARGGGMAEGDG
jgi:molybdopterin-guanine dinucleotide biosynthesis protein A